MVEKDLRFSAGLLNMSDASRYLGIPQSTFRDWARGYDHGQPFLHVLEPRPRPRRANVTFIALAGDPPEFYLDENAVTKAVRRRLVGNLKVWKLMPGGIKPYEIPRRPKIGRRSRQ